jgi:hypothetical protein
MIPVPERLSLYKSFSKPVIPAGRAERGLAGTQYMDVFELAIHGTGYPLPGRYDDICVFVYNDERLSVGTM